MPSKPLTRRRPLDIAAVLAQQAAGTPIQPPTAFLPGYGGQPDPQTAQYGPNVQTADQAMRGAYGDPGNAPAQYGPGVTRASEAGTMNGRDLIQRQGRQTESAQIAGQTPVPPAVMPSGFGQAPERAYVNPQATPASAPTSSSSRPSGLYTTVGDIFAEPAPQSQDPQEWWAFHQDRFRKIANHYNLDPREVAKQEALIAGQIALSPDMSAPQVAQLWEAAEKNLVAANDFTPEQSMQPSPAAQDTTLLGTDGGNPLARYGVYTPEQTAAIQAAIGQYVTQQDQSFQAATGFKPDPKTQQAYMMQAQAFPAINALENQQRLAQQVYELEDQVRYYQALQQTGQLAPQQQTTAAADDGTAAAIASIMDQLG